MIVVIVVIFGSTNVLIKILMSAQKFSKDIVLMFIVFTCLKAKRYCFQAVLTKR